MRLVRMRGGPPLAVGWALLTAVAFARVTTAAASSGEVSGDDQPQQQQRRPGALVAAPVDVAKAPEDAQQGKPASSSTLCPVAEYIDETFRTVQEYYECPGPGDPADHTHCCPDDGPSSPSSPSEEPPPLEPLLDFGYNDNANRCCPPPGRTPATGLLPDAQTARTVALVVMALCVVVSVAVVVCCFAYPCPMYDTCTGDDWSSGSKQGGGGGGGGGHHPWKLPPGDYAPAPDVHPQALGNGGAPADHHRSDDLHRNHRLPGDDVRALEDAKTAPRV